MTSQQLSQPSQFSRRAVPTLLAALFLLFAAFAAEATVNKSIRVGDGEMVDKDLSSVNGGITVGAGAEVRGETSTVNGSIRIGDDARVEEVSTVNGSIRVGSAVTIDGDLGSVNGSLSVEQNTVIAGDASTVNGSINLRGASVQRNIETINGRVELDDGARVKGDMVIGETGGWSWNKKRKPLEIELRGGSVIEGDVIVEDERREVIVILSGDSAVDGEIRGAEVRRE